MPSPEYSVQLDFGEPSPELMQYARQHCHEDPDTRIKAISDLRDLIYERGECNPHRLDDAFLLRFLRARMFVPQRAHRLLVNYYRFKEDNPELFENVYPVQLGFVGETNVVTVPPYLDQNGRRIILYRIGCWDPSSFSMDEIFKATIISLELGVLEPRGQILGGVALFDLEDIGTQHVWQVTPAVASRMIGLMGMSFPATTHAIHIINHSWIFDKIYNIFKPLLSPFMREKIFFHGHDLTSLHKHISPEHLPERYGGVRAEYHYTVWVNELKKNAHIAREMVSLGYKYREDDLSPEVVKELEEQNNSSSSSDENSQ